MLDVYKRQRAWTAGVQKDVSPYLRVACVKEFRLRNSPPAAGRASGIFLSAAVRSPRSVVYFIGALSYEIKKGFVNLFPQNLRHSKRVTGGKDGKV